MKLRGSMVLEAGLLFPLVIFIVISLIVVIYYKHDEIMLRNNVRLELKRCLEEGEQVSDIGYERGLFYLKPIDIKKIEKEHFAKIIIDTKSDIFHKILSLFDTKIENFKVEESYRPYIPQEFVRKLIAIDDFSEKNKK